MNMAELQHGEFLLLRYVPDLLKNEFVNFGLVMRGTSRKGSPSEFASVRFSRDWGRVLCMDSNADLEWLRATEEEFRRLLSTAATREDALRIIGQLSNTIQVSDPQPFETFSP